jgi:hypothetical protein
MSDFLQKLMDEKCYIRPKTTLPKYGQFELEYRVLYLPITGSKLMLCPTIGTE